LFGEGVRRNLFDRQLVEPTMKITTTSFLWVTAWTLGAFTLNHVIKGDVEKLGADEWLRGIGISVAGGLIIAGISYIYNRWQSRR
jgi:hypothetical protein